MRRHTFLKYGCFFGIILAGVVLSLVTRGDRAKRRVTWPVMGTVGAMTFRGGDGDAQEAQRRRTVALWRDLEGMLSAWRTDSESSRLAPRLVAEGRGALPLVSPETRACYAFAFDLREQSGGAFDPVIGKALKRAGFTRVSAFDLGAVAKGFAVDRAWENLSAGDVLLDLGGNLRARGGSWTTGVRNPFAAGAVLGSFELRDGEAVATSGNYERFVVRGGRRLSHILDARTGESVSGTAGVTVLAGTAMLADGLSTTLFVLGPQAGAAFLRAHYPGTAALWLPDTPERPRILATPSMALRLKDPAFPLEIVR